MKNSLGKIYMALIIIFLYAPILIMICLSFNSSKTRTKWGGLSLKWYNSLLTDKAIINALSNTITIALAASVIATVIGTIAAVGIYAMRMKFRTLLVGVANIPMLNADIVTGISLMLLFVACRFTLGFATILVAHITFNIPYVILSVLPRLRQSNKITYEAAMDLGASPTSAFLKVVVPDIIPGVLSGFLMAFTMSLDDFIITHFTKGPGIDTLSTKIYSEVRKGIKPEMYALSTVLFLAVLILMFVINFSTHLEKKTRIPNVLKFTPAVVAAGAILFLLYVRTSANGVYSEKLVVYNWGEYMDPSVISDFEKETGIDVIYEEYETNEIMYPKIQSGVISYDVACPSDYMIEKMIQNNLLTEIDWNRLENASNLDEVYKEKSTDFDPGNKYSIPYCFGTVGILYNKNMVSDKVDSWDILWNDKYKDAILMQDSVRDAFAVALKRRSYSLNSTDVNELGLAMNDLIIQKPLVQAYVVDQVRDKMIGNEAAIGVIYSGEATFCKRENQDLEYVVPKEGSNFWIDSWVIPSNATNIENAYTFLDYLLRDDIALRNFDYITYSTPNKAARALIEDESIKNNKVLFPENDIIDICEVYHYLGDNADAYYTELWNQVKAS